MKIFMIAMESHPISLMYKRMVTPSWKGYQLNFFNAVTPKDLVYRNQLTFDIKRTGKKPRWREFTSTEKAVWYSHFDLWCKCLKVGPILIIEHDSKLMKPLPDMSKEGYKFLSFAKRDWGVGDGIVMAPGSGYYITPPVAERLISRAVYQPITQNSDGHLAEILNYSRQVLMKDYYYIEQINLDGLNTIDHRNPGRKFIGLDYEDFDLPSVHRKAI